MTMTLWRSYLELHISARVQKIDGEFRAKDI